MIFQGPFQVRRFYDSCLCFPLWGRTASKLSFNYCAGDVITLDPIQNSNSIVLEHVKRTIVTSIHRYGCQPGNPILTPRGMWQPLEKLWTKWMSSIETGAKRKDSHALNQHKIVHYLKKKKKVSPHFKLMMTFRHGVIIAPVGTHMLQSSQM